MFISDSVADVTSSDRGCESSSRKAGLEMEPVRPVPSVALGGTLKRCLDLIVALGALILLSPLFLLVTGAIKLTSTGPVFYGHKRVGFGGRTFRCWKFRSMITDGDATLDAYLATRPDERLEWERNRKLKNDPRITRLGGVMREYSIDELPQLLNVILGDMSIVGPRPVVWHELAGYGTSIRHYLRTRPGITGLWQVSGRSDVSFDQRVQLDTHYVTRWSLLLDCLIIFWTIPCVISAKGSY
ncbi:sugar transferase [Roseovarius aestuarii]|uniref:UDP-glucose:undecaprenyl-phosphate glucose-1-phosphate transferase n=1 Tax=Roseovarius aestuarii TaxID=475083 RepID=A0A1X7BTH6_9RHOB|nr:sugar transferase [Roseovarius aestuarii]SMC12863.1 UDP-glucose:undecaprenyl-phosphate glucose-1-phosphate transferase [Roseovarius aestuarii]